MLDANDIKARIEKALAGAQVEVRDTNGTGDHFEAQVVCEAFVGKSMIEQHRLVYGPLDDLIKSGALHALALKTFSPEQWKKFGAR